MDKLYQAFKDPLVGAIIVEGAGIDAACEIFVRLNKQGTPLTIVDIMVAKTYSKTPYFNLREKLEEVNNNLAESFSLDELTILETFSSCLQKGISEKNIINSGEKHLLRDNWAACTEALNRSVDFLQGRSIVPISRFLPFDVLLCPITYFFYVNPKPSGSQLTELEKYFWRASIAQRFIEGQNFKVSQDIKAAEEIIAGKKAPTFDYPFNKGTIKEQDVRFTSSFCKTVFCLYSTLHPRDLSTNEPVALDESFASANTRQIHHLFPINYLKSFSADPQYKTKIEKYIDSVVNVCLTTALSNQAISDKKPSEYLTRLGNPNIKTTLETHLIKNGTYDKLAVDNFDDFLSCRAEAIYDLLRGKIA